MTRRPRVSGATSRLAFVLLLAATPAAADTLLHFQQTASVRVQPDELVAVLEARASGATPADAQSELNTTIDNALRTAHAATAVIVSTGAYLVWDDTSQHSDIWKASQSLDLHSQDGPALLRLIGTLQQQALGVTRLEWRLSDTAEQSARAAAQRRVLQSLRNRAEEAAAALDMRFVEFRDIRLDGEAPAPRLPMPFVHAALAAAPPSAESEPLAVTATADVEAVLQPR